MRKLVAALVAVTSLGLSTVASAGFVVEGSIGNGIVLSSGPDTEQTNLLIAPGLTFASGVLWAELGFMGNVANNAGHSTFELRPMLVISPPLVPLYGRLVVSTIGPDRSFSLDLGAAVGMSASIAGIGLFAEAGYVPRTIDNDRFRVLEGRVGTFLRF